MPGTRDGKPKKVEYKLPISFKITENTVPVPPLPPPPTLSSGCEELFKFVDKIPRFPGCENVADETERKNCANNKLLEYLHKNLKLTPLQVESCASGTVVIKFIVEADGSITTAKIMRDIGVGYGQSALKTVQSMNDNGIRWIPGKQRGRAVRVEYNAPVSTCFE